MAQIPPYPVNAPQAVKDRWMIELVAAVNRLLTAEDSS